MPQWVSSSDRIIRTIKRESCIGTLMESDKAENSPAETPPDLSCGERVYLRNPQLRAVPAGR
jgi:hypothetical protein